MPLLGLTGGGRTVASRESRLGPSDPYITEEKRPWRKATPISAHTHTYWRGPRMYDTFELLRCAAEDSREAARQRQGGIDPTNWEALLDRVEDQLDEDDQDGDDSSAEPISQPLARTCAHAALSPSLFASGALGVALMPPAFDVASSGNQFAVQCLAAGAALVGLGLPATLGRDRGASR